jgi:hypothetical protein
MQPVSDYCMQCERDFKEGEERWWRYDSHNDPEQDVICEECAQGNWEHYQEGKVY